MHGPVEVRWIVDWIGGALASPSDLALLEQLAAGALLALEMTGLALLRVLTRKHPKPTVDDDVVDEAA